MEVSTLPENSISATAQPEGQEGGSGGFGVNTEDGDQFLIGNRWPRQETLALLKIRSDMDVTFRDSGLKAPLWEEVSRKMSELGYNRSAKKCKEKFENINKYHRRTKEGRSGRPNGKTYRFYEQLEALDNSNVLFSSPSPDKVNSFSVGAVVNPISTNVITNAIPCSIRSPSMNSVENTSTSTMSTSSKESEGTRKKKRRLAEFFDRLMNEVIEKQESLQRKFLEAIEKCEQDRMAREEAWKMQELDRIKRERELLAQERSIAAAKDAAVLSFLQKFSDQAGSVQFPSDQTGPVQLPDNIVAPVENIVKTQDNSGLDAHISSSRWPKEEIEALIRLRTNLDLQYQDNGPKGPLWEEISSAMKKLGYDRNAKRCKEKWENMNKYFKRVKDSNKKRPGDSKTCPYFSQLDALYKEKTRKVDKTVNAGFELKPEELLMHMMGGQGERQQPESAMTEDGESENVDQNHEDDDGDKDDGDAYQVVANDPSSIPMME